MERTLTKKHALEIFKGDRQGEELWRKLDSIAKRESWNNYTDSLCLSLIHISEPTRPY